jgi:mRNA-degrading endonuclease RelE of RelBE toxin-antitoxin system
MMHIQYTKQALKDLAKLDKKIENALYSNTAVICNIATHSELY